MSEPTVRTVRVIRRRYLIVEDDGAGGSMAVETSTEVTDHECAPSYSGWSDYHESAARDAVRTIASENLTYGADGGDWFGYPESSTVDYATGEQEETTAHLVGPWTDTEQRAIVRMVEWLDRRTH